MKNNLTYQQKKELRIKYGYYKSIHKSDYNGDFDNYHYDKDEALNDLKNKMISFGLTGDEDIEPLIYTKNQLKFIEDAESANGTLHYDYSGRGMYGDYCPALYCDNHNDITTTVKTSIDNMGLGIVIYVS